MYTVLPVHFQSYEMVDRRSLNNVNNDLPSYYLSQLVHTVLVNLVSTKGQKFKIDWNCWSQGAQLWEGTHFLSW